MEIIMIGLLALGLLIGGVANVDTPPAPPPTEVVAAEMEAVLASPECAPVCQQCDYCEPTVSSVTGARRANSYCYLCYHR